MRDVISEIYNNIHIDLTINDVKKQLTNLHINFEGLDDTTIETQRLDHSFGTDCKYFLFEFENNTLINMEDCY